jgi:hypothetical protein
VSWLDTKIKQIALEIINGSKALDGALRKRSAFLLFIAVVLFALFVWPTKFKDLPSGGYNNCNKFRQDRFSGEVQRWYNGKWIKSAY